MKWIKFDIDDESTYPKNERSPYIFLMRVYGVNLGLNTIWIEKRIIVHYLDILYIDGLFTTRNLQDNFCPYLSELSHYAEIVFPEDEELHEDQFYLTKKMNKINERLKKENKERMNVNKCKTT